METKQNVALVDIQAEIKRLRQQQPRTSDSKACLFNLIVYTHEPRRTGYFKELVKMIMEQFPCRIIFIQGDYTSQESYLRVHVSVEKGQEDKQVACEQIFIEATDKTLGCVPFLILPHFISDLPIYLLWGQDPTKENTILPYLQPFATRLIFDSEATDDLQQFSQGLIERMTKSAVQVIDMNWARMGGWREIVAQVFDSPERLQQLVTASSIKITYNNLVNDYFFHPEMPALYLQAWLAAQLGWKFEKVHKEEQRLIFHYQQPKGPLIIELSGKTQKDLAPEELISLEVTGQNNYSCHMLHKGNHQVEIQACNQFQCELPLNLSLPNLRTGRSFMQDIFYQKMSAHYLPTLERIRLIKWSS